MRKVLIGIQCRSNSTRLPKKCFLPIGGKMIIDHVIDNAKVAANFVRSSYDALPEVQLLVPQNDDELIEATYKKVPIVQGPEQDVLARYVKAANTMDAQYIVRITGDCFYIQPWTISRLLKYALRRKADYTSNVLMRMNPEGYDCEVISRGLLDWLDHNCDTGREREHVTIRVDDDKYDPRFHTKFLIASSKEPIDMSGMKTSIDTQDDYERALADWEERQAKIKDAMSYGKVF